jgi:hypothetical protein
MTELEALKEALKLATECLKSTAARTLYIRGCQETIKVTLRQIDNILKRPVNNASNVTNQITINDIDKLLGYSRSGTKRQLFLTSIRDQLYKGRTLSDKQLNVIQRIKNK